MGMLLVMEMERQNAIQSPVKQETPAEVVESSCGVADAAPQETKPTTAVRKSKSAKK